MPDFILSSYPKTNELPLGIFKPRNDSHPGYWSPVADISLSDYGVAIPGLQWFGRDIGDCVALANGALRYDGEPTVDGSFARVEVSFEEDPGSGLQVPAIALTLFPPAGSTIVAPVVWEPFGVITTNRTATSREFSYTNQYDWPSPPACKAGFDQVTLNLTMVDPRDNDLFTAAWELAACDS